VNITNAAQYGEVQFVLNQVQRCNGAIDSASIAEPHHFDADLAPAPTMLDVPSQLFFNKPKLTLGLRKFFSHDIFFFILA
jgi:hypothetical protein